MKDQLTLKELSDLFAAGYRVRCKRLGIRTVRDSFGRLILIVGE